ncbi:hypothetical protein [Natrinema ejinorense]|uniref:Uncharacterized protein n=1 Tax=Natrinema ejinorense TaxID=373386 RepID=A0A2A5QRJ4_9EURY|nr:hypothetical protein [Natrinema ejinorense]PCR89457.1 hypothetical protein CP557_02225 [Natrinema ejinorense]
MRQLNWRFDHGKPVIIATLLFLVTVIVYLESDLFTADEAVAFGTLFLALITAITVYNTQRQTEYMRKEVEFMRRPRLSLHHETIDGGAGHLVFENTGQVPIEATIRLSLAPVRDTGSDDPILDDEIPYEDLPDSIKVYKGGAGDWRKHTEFLEPGQKKKYIIGMLGHEIAARDDGYELEEFHWLRVDGELTSNLYEGDTRQLQRLYHYSIEDSDVIFSSYSFSEAQSR